MYPQWTKMRSVSIPDTLGPLRRCVYIFCGLLPRTRFCLHAEFTAAHTAATAAATTVLSVSFLFCFVLFCRWRFYSLGFVCVDRLFRLVSTCRRPLSPLLLRFPHFHHHRACTRTHTHAHTSHSFVLSSLSTSNSTTPSSPSIRIRRYSSFPSSLLIFCLLLLSAEKNTRVDL